MAGSIGRHAQADDEAGHSEMSCRLSVLQANITSLSDVFISHLMLCKHDIVLMQEHRLAGTKLYRAINKLGRRFHVYTQHAKIKHVAPSGGSMVLIDKRLDVHANHVKLFKDPTANSVFACIRVKNGNMCFCSAYLPPNDPASALSTMYSIHRNISMIAAPWIVAGDWNLTPDELLDKEWDVMAKGACILPDAECTTTQSNGRLIDYAIASRTMANLIIGKPRLVYDLPCRPHLGIEYIINARPRAMKIPCFLRPKPLEQDGEAEQVSFEKCMEIAMQEAKLGRAPTIIDQYVACTHNPNACAEAGIKYKQFTMAYELHIATKYCSLKQARRKVGRADYPASR